MSELIKEYKMYKKSYKVLWWVTIGLFILELINLSYVNLTQLQNHMGYDASSYYLKAVEMWKQHTPFIKNWVEQTTLYYDSTVPLAAVFMKIFGDIFVAYGVSNLIMVALIAIVFNRIMKKMQISLLIRSVMICVILCPFIGLDYYISNDLGYFSCILSASGCYAYKILISLMFIYSFMILTEKEKIQPIQMGYLAVTCLGILISGISSGYHVGITVIVPTLLYGIMSAFRHNSLKQLSKRNMIFVYINLAITLLGKYLAVHVIHYTSRENGISLIGLYDFWGNLGSIFLGYLELLSGMAYESNVLAVSVEGIIYLSGLALAITILALFVLYVKCQKNAQMKNESETGGVIISVVIFQIIMYAIISSKYGSFIFEIRYLILPFYGMLICAGKCLDSLDENLLEKWFVIAGIIICTLIMSVKSYEHYNQTKIDTDLMNNIKETVSEIDSPVVYVIGDATLGRNMRVYDIDKVYKYADVIEGAVLPRHWGDYTYYDYRTEWPGKVILVSTAGAYELLPQEIQQQTKTVAQYQNITIYTLEENMLGK